MTDDDDDVSGQDAEDTIADVDGSDCDVATHSPDIFKTHILRSCLQKLLSLSFAISSYLQSSFS